MNSDPHARIAAALVEALAAGEDHCVTFQVAGDERAWVQYLGGTLNCAYPSREAPSVAALPAQLATALGGITILKWEPGTFVTYELGSPRAEPLAQLVDSVFTGSLGCEPGDYELEIEHEQF